MAEITLKDIMSQLKQIERKIDQTNKNMKQQTEKRKELEGIINYQVVRIEELKDDCGKLIVKIALDAMNNDVTDEPIPGTIAGLMAATPKNQYGDEENDWIIANYSTKIRLPASTIPSNSTLTSYHKLF
ncbi:hypothetical protein FQA39_LY06591 [Lamprigera yunnana]|nr:hypothetical protein FQA39_LY06591 [Lamprigera yunnana]